MILLTKIVKTWVLSLVSISFVAWLIEQLTYEFNPIVIFMMKVVFAMIVAAIVVFPVWG